jgi:hypothetical protein
MFLLSDYFRIVVDRETCSRRRISACGRMALLDPIVRPRAPVLTPRWAHQLLWIKPNAEATGSDLATSDRR